MELAAVVGASWSNSYVESITEAEQMIPELPSSAVTAWAAMKALGDNYVKLCLVGGAEFIGFAFTIRGYKAYYKQRLAFPRYGQDEYLDFGLSEIPYNVKKAQVYCAIFIIHRNNTALPSSATSDTERRAVNSFSISGLSISLKDNVSGAGTLEEYVKSNHLTLHLMMQDFVTQAKGGVVKRQPRLTAIATTSSTTTTSSSTTTTSSTTV